MTLHLSLPGAHRSNQQQEELREARRVLKEKIRNDWEYGTLPSYRSSGAEQRVVTRKGEDEEEGNIAGFRFHAPSSSANRSGGLALGLDFDPTEWREREEASETEGEASALSATSSSSQRNGKDSAYHFEGPDSVATQLSERRSARKRKRHEALQEEMQWNRGLELWMNRRDEWCCARPATDVRLAERKSAAQVANTSSTSSSPRTSTSSTSQTSSTPATTPSATPDVMVVANSPPMSIPQVLIPVAPSLLPNHPIRRRISTNMYPEIYSKIILQSRTPSVPINLQTLVKALVQGWKDDGEWPPKSGPLEPSLGRKKEGGMLRHGIKRVLRVTGVVDPGRKEVGRKDGDG